MCPSGVPKKLGVAGGDVAGVSTDLVLFAAKSERPELGKGLLAKGDAMGSGLIPNEVEEAGKGVLPKVAEKTGVGAALSDEGCACTEKPAFMTSVSTRFVLGVSFCAM